MPDCPSVLAQMAAFPGLPLAGPALVEGIRPAIRRAGRRPVVNGRVLTARGLEMFGLDAR